MENEKLIMFSWVNMYMSGIHAGIQSGHAWVDMAVRYKRVHEVCSGGNSIADIYWEWAEKHKTVNIRGGGFQSNLIDIVKILQRPDNPYPWMEWREEKDALNEAMTAVAVVIPEHVFAWEPEYDYVPQTGVVTGNPYEPLKVIKNPLDPFDQELYTLIKSTRLAS